MVPLPATEGWTAEIDELRVDAVVYDLSSNQSIRRVPVPRKAVPAISEAYEDLIENILSAR